MHIDEFEQAPKAATQTQPVGIGVAVGVRVGVAVGVRVGVVVGVLVGVAVGVLVRVGVAVGVLVGVLVGVAVGVLVGVAVGVLVRVGVAVGVLVGVLVGVAVGVAVGVLVGVGVAVGVTVGVAVEVAVGVAVYRGGMSSGIDAVHAGENFGHTSAAVTKIAQATGSISFVIEPPGKSIDPRNFAMSKRFLQGLVLFVRGGDRQVQRRSFRFCSRPGA